MWINQTKQATKEAAAVLDSQNPRPDELYNQ